MTETTALSDAQRALLATVLDTLIPPNSAAGLPGAGGLGLVAAIEETMASQAALAAAVPPGLDALAGQLGSAGPEAFAALDVGERSRALEALAEAQPAFVPALVFAAYSAYYMHPEVSRALGLEGRPPFPEGYSLEPFDESLLSRVRERPPMYREC